jgi:hypothetical protein
MRRRRQVLRIRNSLRRHIRLAVVKPAHVAERRAKGATPEPTKQTPSTPLAATNASKNGAAVAARITLSVAVGFGCLWLVAVATGVIQSRDHVQRGLYVAIVPDVGPEGPAGPATRSHIAQQLMDRKVFIRADLDSRVRTDAPRVFRLVVPPAEASKITPPSRFSRADVVLSLMLLREREFTDPVTNILQGTFPIYLSTNHEIAALNDGKIKFTQVPNRRGSRAIFSEVTSPQFVYRVDVPPRYSSNSMPVLWELDIKFKHALDASKGLWEFEWRQTLYVERVATSAPIKAATSVAFDREFEDLRVLPSAAVERAPTIQTEDEQGFATVKASTVIGISERAGNTVVNWQSPAEVSIHGAHAGRKAIADFIVFTMAALFGAAAASLFEVLASFFPPKV